MTMNKPLTDSEMKVKMSRICALCEELFPDEWLGKYTSSREDFRDWLNTKTSLDVDHTADKSEALIAWCNALETLAQS
jgi:hypothetical protein